MEDIKIYIDSYNGEISSGKFMDVDEALDFVEKYEDDYELRTADLDNDPAGLEFSENVDANIRLMEHYNALDEFDREKVWALLEAGIVVSIEDIIDYDIDEVLLYGADSDEDLAHLLIDEMYGGAESLDSETIERYFDYEEFGKNYTMDLDEEEMEEYGYSDMDNYDIGVRAIDDLGIEGISNIDWYFDYASYGRDLAYDFDKTSFGYVLRA